MTTFDYKSKKSTSKCSYKLNFNVLLTGDVKWHFWTSPAKPHTSLPFNDDHITISNVTTNDAGVYDCVDASNGVTLTSERVSVRSETSLLVPVSEDEFFVSVIAGQSAVIPCLLADPDNPEIKVDLYGQVRNQQTPLVSKRTILFKH